MVEAVNWITFALWLAYGFWLWHRRESVIARAVKVHSSRRIMKSLGMLIGGTCVLFLTLIGIDAAGGLKLFWAWPAILLAGLVFVHGQLYGVIYALSNLRYRDTPTELKSSNMQEEENHS